MTPAQFQQAKKGLTQRLHRSMTAWATQNRILARLDGVAAAFGVTMPDTLTGIATDQWRAVLRLELLSQTGTPDLGDMIDRLMTQAQQLDFKAGN